MAALYIHNAIWTPENSASSAAATSGQPGQHIQRQSSRSTGTLRTTTSDHSHPTEPLLLANTSESIAYKDLLSRQPPHPNGPQAAWDVGLTFEGDPTTLHERKSHQQQLTRRRIRRLRLSRTVLEIVMGAWALFNVVRYFMVYNLYTSPTGQAASLALGTIATFSIAFLMSAALFSTFRQYLLFLRVSIYSLLLARSILEWLTSCFLIVPALVNLGLVFAWRNSPDAELSLRDRCYLDIDVVWSLTKSRCHQAPSWGKFLALSIIRVLLTLLHLMFYHIISRAYHKIRRPSMTRNARHTSRPLSFRPPAFLQGRPQPPPPFQPLASNNPSISSTTSTQHPQPSRTITPARQTGDHNSVNSSTSRHSQSGGSRTVTTVNSPHSSEKELPTPEYDKYANFDPSMPQGFDDDVLQPPNNDGGLNGFVDSFRLLVNQITRQTEEGMAFTPGRYLSPSGSASTSTAPYSTPRTFNNNNSSNPLDTGFSPYGGYRSQPGSSHVRVLGGYIRRMPTIESLGSHEMGSVAHSSVRGDEVHRDDGPRSPSIARSMSRPSRRSTLSTVSSGPSSRTNSITTNLSHHLMSGGGGGGSGVGRGGILASEMNELVGQPKLMDDGGGGGGGGGSDNDSVGSEESVSFHIPESSQSSIPFLPKDPISRAVKKPPDAF